MIYVALLRGINVGGNAKVEMPRLKKIFESLGCKDVVTYINSGNVIFSDARQARRLVPIIEQAINKEFGLNIRVVIRDQASIQMICKEIPDSWANDDKQKSDVMFLWKEIDTSEIMKKVVYKPELETVRYLPGALIWNISRNNVTRGGSIKLIKTDLYKYMTIRNINTVRKLNTLMSGD